MKLMDLFKAVQRAPEDRRGEGDRGGRERRREVRGDRGDVGKHALILHAGKEVDTRYRPKTQNLLTAQAIHERATRVMEAVANGDDLLPPRAG